jgi:hypothetical protein
MRTEEFLKSLDYELVIWDWKQQIPIQEIQPHLKNGFIHLNETDTGGDCYAAVLTKIEVTEEEAQYIYDNCIEEEMAQDKEEEDD